MPDNSAGHFSARPARPDGGDVGAVTRGRRGRRAGRARGFTLLEVLVAFVILALALAALVQTFGSGMRGVAASERHVMAALAARSLLERVGHDIPLESGEVSGEDGAFTWTVSMRRAGRADRRGNDQLVIVPYDVAVTVGWRGGRGVTLESYRLAPIPAGEP
ncbi:MAG: prepilin-type N-terminal cleavage/methylation domain-containing protein [Rhodospirillales bacterium]|nr:prepilin-type N-terminal cleavage/methylation domain-containing protein [Rhodospirillales bacterium]